ncbi:MAG: exosortase C-terminal domain/associated protein EpsI [bacterium]
MNKRNIILEVGIWLAIAAGIGFLFFVEGNNEEILSQGRSAIGWMIGRWNWAGADMSHGWIVPLVSLYMAWWKREEMLKVSKAISWGGFFVVILALLLYLAGLRIQQTRFVLVSLIMLLWGVPFFLFGRQIARILVFPCGYLVFCIPMSFLDSLTFPLRMISSSVSEAVLDGCGISVTRIGTAMHINSGGGFSLDVAHPCSGLRYLLAMVALTTAYAYFTQNSAVKRGILSLSAIPLAMAGNIARIILIAIVGVWFGQEFALGFYHDYSGYVVFAVATSLMLGVGTLLHRYPALQSLSVSIQDPSRLDDRKPSENSPSESCAPSEQPPARWFGFNQGACSVLVLLGLTALFASRIREIDVASSQTADLRRELPSQVGEWKGEWIFYCQSEKCMRSFPESELDGTRTCPSCGGILDQVSLGERNLLPPDSIITRRMYQNEEGKHITVTIVLSGNEQRSIHRPQQCLPAQGFSIDQSSVLTVPLTGRSPLQLMLIHAQKGPIQMLMGYWFAGGGHETHDHFRRMAYMAWDNLIHGIRPRWAYVSLQTSASTNEKISTQRLADFVRELYPLLKPVAPTPQ